MSAASGPPPPPLAVAACCRRCHVRSSTACRPGRIRAQLVLINISDHHTRTRANALGGAAAAPPAVRVLGCLLGSQAGRTVDIQNSFELRLVEGGGEAAIDEAFLAKKMEQCEWPDAGLACGSSGSCCELPSSPSPACFIQPCMLQQCPLRPEGRRRVAALP